VVWRHPPQGAQQGTPSGNGSPIPPTPLIERIDEPSPAPVPSGNAIELRGGGISIIVTD
jgi:hypothetical protein